MPNILSHVVEQPTADMATHEGLLAACTLSRELASLMLTRSWPDRLELVLTASQDTPPPDLRLRMAPPEGKEPSFIIERQGDTTYNVAGSLPFAQQIAVVGMNVVEATFQRPLPGFIGGALRLESAERHFQYDRPMSQLSGRQTSAYTAVNGLAQSLMEMRQTPPVPMVGYTYVWKAGTITG
jgi:hypothetical protein